MNRQTIGVALACGLAAAATIAPGQTVGRSAPESIEYQVKAAMVFNFAKFVDWPSQCLAGAKSPMVIGVLGRDPFGALLDAVVRDQSLFGRPVRIERWGSLPASGGCRVIFIARSEKKKLNAILADLPGQANLTVSDLDGFTRLGGCIGLVLRDGTVRFEVNLDATRRQDITLSSKLLRLAISTAAAGRDGGS